MGTNPGTLDEKIKHSMAGCRIRIRIDDMMMIFILFYAYVNVKNYKNMKRRNIGKFCILIKI